LLLSLLLSLCVSRRGKTPARWNRFLRPGFRGEAGKPEGDPIRSILARALLSIAATLGILGGIAWIEAARAPVLAQAATATVDFHAALDPYGTWERHSRWGEVWLSANRPRDWRPYTDGQWGYTEE
jgi:hypothetical protein